MNIISYFELKSLVRKDNLALHWHQEDLQLFHLKLSIYYKYLSLITQYISLTILNFPEKSLISNFVQLEGQFNGAMVASLYFSINHRILNTLHAIGVHNKVIKSPAFALGSTIELIVPIRKLLFGGVQFSEGVFPASF